MYFSFITCVKKIRFSYYLKYHMLQIKCLIFAFQLVSNWTIYEIKKINHSVFFLFHLRKNMAFIWFWSVSILLITLIFVKNKEVRSNDTFVDDSGVIFNQLERVVVLEIFDQISQFSFWRKMNPSGFDQRSLNELRILRSSK